jgi:Tfp pilus assembly protein PilF
MVTTSDMVKSAPAWALIAILLTGCDPAPNVDREQAQSPTTSTSHPAANYVGSADCATCHQTEYQAWSGSHHQQAMLAPTAQNVTGDFDNAGFEYDGIESHFSTEADRYLVVTDGAHGRLEEFEVRYAFGVDPLQQYLLALPGGRLQALGIAWDSRPPAEGGQRWFHLHPDEQVDHTDVLHWTRDSQNWNYMCADCHSTNVRKDYDKDTHSYQSQFSEISVGCEACHGPASNHVAWANTGIGESGLQRLGDQARQINACAPCHSRRSQLAEGFRPHLPYLDHYLPALLDSGLYYADGQVLDEVYVYGSFLQSKMHAQGVTCSHCHEPHSATLRTSDNGLCSQCHSSSPRADFPTLAAGNYDSPEHHMHPAGSPGSRCIACHMTDRTYMQVDDRRDHSFRIPRPDLSESLGVPNACNNCHTNKSPAWARERIAKQFGDERANPFGPIIHAARRADPEAELALAELAEDQAQPAIVRATAMSLMIGYQRGATAFALNKGLRDPSPLVRIGALRGAERWEPQRRWQEAQHLLNDRYRAVRTEAARLLSVISGDLPQAEQARLTTGLEEYLTTQSLHADRAEAQTNIASVWTTLSEPARAEEALVLALDLNPQWVPALVNLADLYRANGRDEKGGPLLTRAMAMVPDNADVLVAKALWLVRQQHADQALPLLANAVKLMPANNRYSYIYGVALHSSGDSQQAFAVIDAALAREPYNQQLLQAAAGIARDTRDAARLQKYVLRLQKPESR